MKYKHNIEVQKEDIEKLDSAAANIKEVVDFVRKSEDTKERENLNVFLDSAMPLSAQIPYLNVIEKSYEEEIRRSNRRTQEIKKQKAEQKRLERKAKKEERERLERGKEKAEESRRTKEIISKITAIKKQEAAEQQLPTDNNLLKIQETSNTLFNNLWGMLRNFPKWERSSLVFMIKENMITFQSKIRRGRYVPSLRLGLYKDAQMAFEDLKSCIEISYHQGYIVGRSYKYTIIQMEYIGKMLTNLIKSVSQNNNKK